MKALIGQKTNIYIPGSYFEDPDKDLMNFSSQLIDSDDAEQVLPDFIIFDQNSISYMISP